jgi:two-component system sensor histidine kinase MprB
VKRDRIHVAWRAISIRHRFVAVASLCLLVAIVVVTVAAYLVSRGSLEDQLNRSLRQQFDQVARSVHSGSNYVVTGPCQYLAEPACARIVNSRGETVKLDGIESRIPVPPGSSAVAAGQVGPLLYDATYDGRQIRVYTAQLRSGYALLVAEPSSDLHTDLRDLEIALLIVGLVGLAVVVTLMVAMTRASLAPIDTLVVETQGIAAARDPSMRVDDFGNDELSLVARSFNDVLAQLEDSIGAQRALVADASHELRTPLTGLRANVDLLRESSRLTSDQRDATVAALDAQVRDLITLVNALIDLARGAEADAHREPVRLDELVEQCVRRARRNWPAATFETSLEQFVVEATPARLATAIGNILDNAAKFAGDAGPIMVVLCDGTLSITDRGPGIPETDRERVFDRFYRAPDARAVPGSGLGLAIAGEAVTSAGGSIAAGPVPDGHGTTITVHLPPAALT